MEEELKQIRYLARELTALAKLAGDSEMEDMADEIFVRSEAVILYILNKRFSHLLQGNNEEISDKIKAMIESRVTKLN